VSNNIPDEVHDLLEKAKIKGFAIASEIDSTTQEIEDDEERIRISDFIYEDLESSKVKIIDDSEKKETVKEEEEEEIAGNDDPVKIYFNQIGNYRLLSKEEEQNIAIQIEQKFMQNVKYLCLTSLLNDRIREWHHGLSDGTLSLKDVIVIDTTEATPGEGEEVLDEEERNLKEAAENDQMYAQVLESLSEFCEKHKEFLKSNKRKIMEADYDALDSSLEKLAEELLSLQIQNSKIVSIFDEIKRCIKEREDLDEIRKKRIQKY
jgi:hypothetical protein